MLREGKGQEKKWVEEEQMDFPHQVKPKSTKTLGETAAIEWPDEKKYYMMWEKAGAIDAFYIDPDARIIILFQVKDNNTVMFKEPSRAHRT